MTACYYFLKALKLLLQTILTSLIPPYSCACPKPEPVFPKSYDIGLFMFTDFRYEVIVCFVDIRVIVDHHNLNFLFIRL